MDGLCVKGGRDDLCFGDGDGARQTDVIFRCRVRGELETICIRYTRDDTGFERRQFFAGRLFVLGSTRGD